MTPMRIGRESRGLVRSSLYEMAEVVNYRYIVNEISRGFVRRSAFAATPVLESVFGVVDYGRRG